MHFSIITFLNGEKVNIKMAKTLLDRKGWLKETPGTEPLNLSKHNQPTSVKQTLKSLIKSRRIAEGKDELQVDFHVEKTKCEVKINVQRCIRVFVWIKACAEKVGTVPKIKHF